MTLMQLGINLMCIVVGAAIGYWSGVRHNKKLDVVDPEHAPHKVDKSKFKGAIGVVLFIMAIYIVFSASQTNDKVTATIEQRASDIETQTQCNDEFFRVLQERALITAADNKIARDDATALQTLVKKILSNPPLEDSQQRTIEALREYDNIVQSNNEQRLANERERAANPYPEPRCGN